MTLMLPAATLSYTLPQMSTYLDVWMLVSMRSRGRARSKFEIKLNSHKIAQKINIKLIYNEIEKHRSVKKKQKSS